MLAIGIPENLGCVITLPVVYIAVQTMDHGSFTLPETASRSFLVGSDGSSCLLEMLVSNDGSF